MDEKSVEILCSACQAEALLIRTPKYDGFTRVGEVLTCAACGHEYSDEEAVPFKAKQALHVFTEDDRPEQVEVFEEGETERLCRYCQNYVVNPFMQWCAHHNKEVEATDTCKDFEKKQEKEKDEKSIPQE